MDNKDNKVADNYELKVKEKDNQILKKIDEKKSELKKIDKYEEEIIALNNSVNKCLNILNRSIKGGNIKNIIDSTNEENNNFYSKSMAEIEYEKEKINKELKEILKEKNENEKNKKKESE